MTDTPGPAYVSRAWEMAFVETRVRRMLRGYRRVRRSKSGWERQGRDHGRYLCVEVEDALTFLEVLSSEYVVCRIQGGHLSQRRKVEAVCRAQAEPPALASVTASQLMYGDDDITSAGGLIIGAAAVP